MKQLRIRKGHSLKISGAPSLQVDTLPRPDRVALLPRRIPHVKPRLLVESGDRIALGSPLIEDKRNPSVRFMSPGGGEVEEIKFGSRRVITRIVVRLDDEEQQVVRDPVDPQALEQMPREDLVQRLVDGGLWPFLKVLPFRDYPSPDDVPPAVIVGLGSLEPFQPDPEVYLEGREALFALGIAVLKKLAGDPSTVCVSAEAQRVDALKPYVDGALTHAYRGAYPAHDPGVVLYHIRTEAAQNRSWFIDGQDLLLAAEYLQSGTYPTLRVMVAAGSRARVRQHYRTRLGSPLAHLGAAEDDGCATRWVVGGIFTGYTGSPDSYMGLFETSLILLPEGDQREFLALFNPGARKLTYSRAFLSALNPADLTADCNLHGGLRACIACGHCNEVCPVDILPQLTYKAVLADEIEEFLSLGLLDCVECGLCSYVCPSKIDLVTTLREARKAYYREQG
jgi:Na+-transporting NADH:ubiquinone oxidoreductase subunit A